MIDNPPTTTKRLAGSGFYFAGLALFVLVVFTAAIAIIASVSATWRIILLAITGISLVLGGVFMFVASMKSRAAVKK